MKTISPVRIAKIEDTGRKIILDDNSEWEVYLDDIPTLNKWFPPNWVIVWRRDQLDPWKWGTQALYPYVTIIEYLDSGRKVGVKQIK